MRTRLGALWLVLGGVLGCASAPIASAPAAAPQPEAPPENPAAAGEPANAKLACSGPRDCLAGNVCCTTPLWDGTFCAAACDLANNGQLCADHSDCPELGGKETSCAPVSPEDAPALPASFKACR